METVAALGVLAGIALPLVRAVASRPFRTSFPHLARKGYWLLFCYAAFLAIVFTYFSVLIMPLGAAATGVAVLVVWRARPDYGGRRGLPPGSLSLLPLGPWFDANFFRDHARRYGAIFKSSYFFTPMVCIVGLKPGLELIRRHDEILGTPPLPFSRFIPGGYLRYMDPAVHGDYKRIFRRIFSPDVVRRNIHCMRNDFEVGLRSMAASAREPDTGGGIQPKSCINRMLLDSWLRLFTGLSPDSSDAMELKRQLRIIDMRNPTRASDRTVNRALSGIAGILRRQMDELDARARLSDSAPGCFLAVLAGLPAEQRNDETVVRNFIYFLHVTWSDVAGLLLWLMKMLGDHPEWLARVRDAGDGSKLSEHVVMETLRLEQSEHLYRKTLETIKFQGFTIPAGWIVRVCIRESHQDNDVFSEPESFDPLRFQDKSYRETEYCPFGTARLACLGQYLTKTTGKLFVDVLATQFDLVIKDDGPRYFGSWRHWRPSKRYRVQLVEAPAPVIAGVPGRTPRVSVIMPAYNAEHHIERTLGSALAQSFKDFEIVVVDDGSTDGTADVVKVLAARHPNIMLLEQKNRGIAAARNFGIRHARGGLIAFLDADDLWHPMKLQRQVACLDANPGAGLANCYSALLDANGACLGWRFGGRSEGSVYRSMLKRDLVAGGSVPLVRGAALRACGLFDETVSLRSDWDMWLRLSRHHRFTTVPELLVGYTRCTRNSSRDYDEMRRVGEIILRKAAAHDPAFTMSMQRFCLARDTFGIASLCFIDGNRVEAWRHIRSSLSLSARPLMLSLQRWGVVFLLLCSGFREGLVYRTLFNRLAPALFGLKPGQPFDDRKRWTSL